MRMTITIDVPDIVGEALQVALDGSERVLVCPEAIAPGYIGTIVKEDT